MNGDPPRNAESKVREDDAMTSEKPAAVTPTGVVRALDGFTVEQVAKVAQMVDYSTAVALNEQVRRRLIEDDAPRSTIDFPVADE